MQIESGYVYLYGEVTKISISKLVSQERCEKVILCMGF